MPSVPHAAHPCPVQSLRGVNTRGPSRMAALGGAGSQPATPMTAGGEGGDVFDALVTPNTVAAAAGAAAAAAAFHRPDGVPPLNTAALAAAGGAPGGRAPSEAERQAGAGEAPLEEEDLPTGTSYYTAVGGRSTAMASLASSAFTTGRGGRPSDASDGLQAPAASGGAVAAAAAGGQAAERRPGFRMDINELSEGSVSGAVLVEAAQCCWGRDRWAGRHDAGWPRALLHSPAWARRRWHPSDPPCTPPAPPPACSG